MAASTGSAQADVLIVGGGVIGCAIAYYLAKAGVSVTVIERGELGGEASGAAAGLLTPLAETTGPGPFLDLALASLRMFPSLAQSLGAESGIDVNYIPSGLLRVALREGEADDLRERFARQRGLGLPLEWLDGSVARALEPRLSPHLRAAILSPDEHQVDPGRLVQALAEAARRQGARLHPDTAVRGFLRRGQRLAAVRTSDGTLPCDHLVLAAGPWTRPLAAKLGVDVPTRPMRGQMLAIGGLSAPIRHAVWGAGGYLVPKTGGFVFVGATVEDVGFRRRTTQRGLAWLQRLARTLLPALAYGQVVSAWAALRPGSPDRLPILGPLPGWDNVSLATGHFRSGILLAPITGKLMAQHILEGKTEVSLAPFSPSRFGQECLAVTSLPSWPRGC